MAAAAAEVEELRGVEVGLRGAVAALQQQLAQTREAHQAAEAALTLTLALALTPTPTLTPTSSPSPTPTPTLTQTRTRFYARSDGMVTYRAEELAQSGRMLTIFALYVSYTGDTALVLWLGLGLGLGLGLP